MSIAIGSAAISRNNGNGVYGHTWLDKLGPANANGVLDTFQVYYTYENGTNVKIGTFGQWGVLHDYVTVGTVYTNQTSTFTGLNCAVSTGDNIGISGTGGCISNDNGSSGNCQYSNSDEFVDYSGGLSDQSKIISLCGTGSSVSIPAAPTNFAATKNQSDKVTLTWTRSLGAAGYKIYKNSTLLQTVSDVATYDDTAAAPVITGGTANATDGSLKASVTLTLSGQSIANGTTATYYVTATNTAGESSASGTDTGYRLASALTLQWQRSSADLNGSFTDISGATTNPYSDTGAPSDGSIRQFRCVLSATNSTTQNSTTDSGCRAAMSGGVSRARIVNGA
jgi:hypothetical protein